MSLYSYAITPLGADWNVQIETEVGPIDHKIRGTIGDAKREAPRLAAAYEKSAKSDVPNKSAEGAVRSAERTLRELGYTDVTPSAGPNGVTYCSPQARELDGRMGLSGDSSTAARYNRANGEFVVGGGKGNRQ